MSAYFGLSLRKARLAAAGLLAAFFFTLLIAPRSGRGAGYAPRQALDAALLFWALLGAPAAALILGGSAGAQARAESALEAPLPLSQARRAFLSMAAAALMLAALAGVIGATAAVLGTDWRQAALILPSIEPMLAPYLWVIAVVSLYALALSFGAAFATGSGAAGGLLAGIVAVLLHAFLFGAFVFHLMFPPRGSFVRLLALVAAGSLAAALRLAWSAARQARLRGRPWLAGLRQAGVVLAGLAFAFVATRVWIERFADKLVPFDGVVACAKLSKGGRVELDRLPLGGGKLLASLKGRLVWSSGGRLLELVPPRSPRAEDAVRSAFAGTGDLFRMKDGSLWLLRRSADGRAELWTARRLEPMKRAAVLPAEPHVDYVADGPQGPELIAFSAGRRLRAPLDPSKPPRWTRLPSTVYSAPRRKK